MMIEIMAGKSGALHGLVHDASPFKFSEDDSAIDYFGKLLDTGEKTSIIIYTTLFLVGPSYKFSVEFCNV